LLKGFVNLSRFNRSAPMNTAFRPPNFLAEIERKLFEAIHIEEQPWIDEDEMRAILSEALRKGISPRTIIACRNACASSREFVARMTTILRRGCQRVLVVDPDQQTCDQISRYLAETGCCQVRAETNAHHALEAAAEYDPDILIVDLRLPGPGGPRMAGLVRRMSGRHRLPVVFLTELLRATGYSIVNSSGTLHLTKPVKLKSLLHCVEQLLSADRRNQHRQPDTGT
jgi:two-component system, OmpR family, response regulator